MFKSVIFTLWVSFTLAGPVGAASEIPAGITVRALSANEQTIIAAAVQKILKDPKSADFEWRPLVLAPKMAGENYCLRENARNGFGGYTGFTYIMMHVDLSPEKQVIAANDVMLAEGIVAEVTETICRGRGY
jgi:hypothetical protein